MTLHWSRIVSGVGAVVVLVAATACGPHRPCKDPCHLPPDRGRGPEGGPGTDVPEEGGYESALSEVANPAPSPSPSDTSVAPVGFMRLVYTNPATGLPAYSAVDLQSAGGNRYYAEALQIPPDAMHASSALMEVMLYGSDPSVPKTFVVVSLRAEQTNN